MPPSEIEDEFVASPVVGSYCVVVVVVLGFCCSLCESAFAYAAISPWPGSRPSRSWKIFVAIARAVAGSVRFDLGLRGGLELRADVAASRR
jgi:hypothetical protein